MSRRTMMVLALLCTTAAWGASKGARYSARRPARFSAAAGSASAVQFEVTADEAFPVRALDPVLYVGDVLVRDYRYADMENKTLIFTCSEPDRLRDDAVVYLQYGNDTRSRTALPRFRWNSVR